MDHPFRSRNCPDAGSLSSIMSPMTALIVMGFLFGGVYCVGGCLYNRAFFASKGVQQIPHYEFWSSCCEKGPAAICGLFSPKPRQQSMMMTMQQGLVDDDDDDDMDDDDAEERLYDE